MLTREIPRGLPIGLATLVARLAEALRAGKHRRSPPQREDGGRGGEGSGNGTSELVRHFDPAAQETVSIPRLVGG